MLRAPRTPEQVCEHTCTLFRFQNFQKWPFGGLFRVPKTESRKNTLRLVRYTRKRFTYSLGSKLPVRIVSRPEKVCAHTGTHFRFQNFQKWPFLGLFRGPKTKPRKNTLKHALYTPQTIHILFGVQISGANRITPQNKYVHTRAHMFEAETSAKMAIFEGFRGTNFSSLKMVPKHVQ